jgi:hypothetical protein
VAYRANLKSHAVPLAEKFRLLSRNGTSGLNIDNCPVSGTAFGLRSPRFGLTTFFFQRGFALFLRHCLVLENAVNIRNSEPQLIGDLLPGQTLCVQRQNFIRLRHGGRLSAHILFVNEWS